MKTFHHLRSIYQGRVPGQLVIQFTDHCNATCPQCGMRVSNKFPRSRLRSDDIRRIIDTSAAKGIEVLSFTGGEPLLFLDDLTRYLDHARRAGITYTRTGTNGFLFARHHRDDFLSDIRKIAERFSAVSLRNFWISIDSAEPSVHEKMRGFPGVIEGIEKALPVFHERGLYPSANLGINRNMGGIETSRLKPEDYESKEAYHKAFYRTFRAAFSRFYQTVINLGFTMVNVCYPMSSGNEGNGDKAVYAANSVDRVVSFTSTEKSLLFKALFDTIPEFRSKIRVFSPRISLLALFRQYSANGNASSSPYPCRGGKDFFFIDAHGAHVYPCGYRGNESLGNFSELSSAVLDSAPSCVECDWECFRDPSELFGPLLQLFSNPNTLLKKMCNDKTYLRYWIEDLKYYKACSFFDGRRPPQYENMRRF